LFTAITRRAALEHVAGDVRILLVTPSARRHEDGAFAASIAASALTMEKNSPLAGLAAGRSPAVSISV